MNAKEKLKSILNGEINFYFRFSRIAVFDDGRLVANLTDANSPGGGSVFKRGGLMGGIIAKIDIDEDDTWSMIQRCGAFRGMYSGFDLYLDFHGWQLNSNTVNQYSIAYFVGAGGIDSLALIAEGEAVRLQIVSGHMILLLTDVLNFY